MPDPHQAQPTKKTACVRLQRASRARRSPLAGPAPKSTHSKTAISGPHQGQPPRRAACGQLLREGPARPSLLAVIDTHRKQSWPSSRRRGLPHTRRPKARQGPRLCAEGCAARFRNSGRQLPTTMPGRFRSAHSAGSGFAHVEQRSQPAPPLRSAEATWIHPLPGATRKLPECAFWKRCEATRFQNARAGNVGMATRLKTHICWRHWQGHLQNATRATTTEPRTRILATLARPNRQGRSFPNARMAFSAPAWPSTH